MNCPTRYTVGYDPTARKELNKLDRQAARRIAGAIAALGTEPRPAGSRRLVEYDALWQVRQLLLAVLPPNLVDEDGEVVGTGEAAGQATVVAVVLVPTDEHQDLEQAGEGFRGAAQLAERVATETGLERVRMAADRFLFLAGMDHDDAGADAAVGFAAQFRSRLDTEAADSFELHVGLSSGAVATGLLDTRSLTFGAWGERVRRALALASLSQVDVVLVDASTARACTDRRWRFEPAHDVVDLDGQLMDLYRLDDEDGMPAHP